MSATRREFLATAAALGAGCAVSAFPIPIRRAAETITRLSISDEQPPLPVGALKRLGSRRLRTSRTIHRVQFAAHGKAIIAADSNEIRGWDTATARPIFSMPYPEKSDLKAGRVTNCDTICVIASVEGGSKYEIHHLSFSTGKSESRAGTPLTSLDASAFNADGSRVAILRNGTLYLFDGRATRELWTKPASTNDRGTDMLFLDSDRILAIPATDGLRLIDVETGKDRDPLKSEPRAKKNQKTKANAVDALATSGNGQFLAGIGGENRDRYLIWDMSRNELILSIAEKDLGSPLGFAPDGEMFFANRNGRLLVYSVASGKLVRSHDIGPAGNIYLSPDATILAASSGDSILFFETATGRLHPLSSDPPGLPTQLHFAGRNRLIGRLSDYGGWIEWNLEQGTSKLLRPAEVGTGVPLGLSDDGRVALYNGKDILRRWDITTGTESPGLPYDSNRSVPTAAVSGDGGRIVADDPNGLIVWDARTGKQSSIRPDRVFANGRNQSDALTLSADGQTAAIALQIPELDRGQRHFIEVYSLVSQRMIQRIPADGQFSAFQFSADGTRIAVVTNGGYDRRGGEYRYGITVYDPRTGHLVFKTKSGSDSRIIALSPDNRLLAHANPNSLDIWELAGGGKRLQLTIPGDATSIAFALDGASVAVAGSGGPVLIWDIRGALRPKPSRPDSTAKAKLLESLADPDAVAAYETLRLVAAWPGETIPIIAKEIATVTPPDADKLKDCIAKLDAPAFADRDKATRDLLELGDLAAPSLRAVLAESGSAEVRQRAESILQYSSGQSPADLKTVRAVEALEWATTPEAKANLANWAAGATGARLTEDAKSALKRIR